MSFLSSFMIPFLICLIFAYALTHKVDEKGNHKEDRKLMRFPSL